MNQLLVENGCAHSQLKKGEDKWGGLRGRLVVESLTREYYGGFDPAIGAQLILECLKLYPYLVVGPCHSQLRYELQDELLKYPVLHSQRTLQYDHPDHSLPDKLLLSRPCKLDYDCVTPPPEVIPLV